jgi:hypothetical protein
MVNMYNARSFLEDGVYKTTEECKVRSSGEPLVTLTICGSSATKKREVGSGMLILFPYRGPRPV